MHLELHDGNDARTLTTRHDGDSWSVTLDGAVLPLEVLAADGAEISLLIDGERKRAYVARRGVERLVFLDGTVHVLRLADDDTADDQDDMGDTGPNIVAKMPGTVVKVLVAEGDAVKTGDPLLIIEAMKMETEIASPLDGRVAQVYTSAGQVLAAGEPLVDLDPDDAGDD